MHTTTAADDPGVGEGWKRLAALVADRVPVTEVDGLWVFRPMMHEGRQWGTAVFTRVDGDRRRIYTARYMHQLKGKERGTYSAEVTEVGSGVVETLDDILALAEHRLEEEPPVRIPIDRWFPPGEHAPGDTD
jgi:hypothetical protein